MIKEETVLEIIMITGSLSCWVNVVKPAPVNKEWVVPALKDDEGVWVMLTASELPIPEMPTAEIRAGMLTLVVLDT